MLAGLPEVLQRNSVDTHWIIYIDEILAIGVYMADLRTSWTKTVEKMRIQLKMLQNQPLHIKLCFFNGPIATIPARQGQTILLVGWYLWSPSFLGSG